MDAFNKLYGNAIVLKHLYRQRQVPYFSDEKLSEIRDRRLQRIIQYAAKTVPYYQEIFKSHRLNPDHIQTAGDLDKLPMITKDMVRQDPLRFVSKSRRARSSVLFKTSGSTGVPLHIYHDRASLLANIAFGERERAVIAKMCGKSWGYTTAAILYSGSTTEKVQDLYRRWTCIPVRPATFTFSVVSPFEEIVEGLNRLRPDVLFGYGSYMETFFRTLALRNMPLHAPKALIYAAEGMTREGRQLIEDRFGIPVLSQFNAMEAFKIGFTCEERNGFHIHEDLCHIKIVNERGENAMAGERGEVVISNLVNHGTVLLNYRLGDIGSLSDRKCACGRTLLTLSELEGRMEDMVFLPGGRFIHARAIWGVIKQTDGICKYQLIQHEPEHFELRLVTADPGVYAPAAQKTISGLRSLLGETVRIECGYHEDLTPQGREKFRAVISQCRPEPLE